MRCLAKAVTRVRFPPLAPALRQISDDREQKTEMPIADAIAIKTVKDLKVYQVAYALASQIFEVSKDFPKEEVHSLTDQIRRSSRSVPMNIREGFAKKKYHQIFIRHLNDALGSSEETRGWLDISRDCCYLSKEKHESLDRQYDEVNAMLYSLINSWQTYSND